VIIYGRNAVREALRGPRVVSAVWATERVAEESWLQGAPVEAVEPAEVEARCGSPAHQGVCAQAGPYEYAAPEALLEAPEPLIVALDEVTDPQNLGAICRTVEVAGGTGVVVGRHRSA
jgi:23S rRNA (guanosine2251-2'-O)-methyltransferase